MEEIFKDIIGFEGYYQVSNFGRIKSLERVVMCGSKFPRIIKESILNGGLDNLGYPRVSLRKECTHIMKRIHKLMHTTFTDKFNKGLPCIDHIDRDKTNNHIDNLRECTYNENNRNKTKNQNKSSKYMGVAWDISKLKWKASIGVGNKSNHLGEFKSEIEAGKVYDSVAKYYYKEFANLNFPNDDIIPTSIEENKAKNRKRRTLSSKYRGVSWKRSGKKWAVTIRIQNKSKHIGVFVDEEEAGRAYDKIALETFGDSAILNFPNTIKDKV